VADHGHAQGLLQAVAARDGAALLAGVQALREAGASAMATLEAMAGLLQAAAVEQAVPGALDDGDADTPAARALAAALAPDETQLLYSIVLHGRGELALSSDEYGALTMVLLRLFAFPPAGAPAPAATRPQALRAPAAAVTTVPIAGPSARGTAAARPPVSPAPRATATAPRAAAPVPGAAAEPDTTAIARDLGDRWAALVAQLISAGVITALTRELALQAGLAAVDEPGASDPSTLPARWRLCVARESLRAPVLAERLGAALAGVVGRPVAIELQAGQPDDTPALREAAARARRQREAEQAIVTDPVVADLLDRFPGARIVPGSIKPLDPTH
jgi:DNA polymerase-3 subunit gamma/tau